MDDLRRARYLELIGITRWRRRETGAPVPPSQGMSAQADPRPPAAPAEAAAAIASMPEAPAATLESLAAEVAACTRCALHATRTQTVFGVGTGAARVMFVGEAPGEREDQQGEPFVGPAGQLLNAMLRAIGLGREDVYIANILKCRPPRNRDPEASETAQCTPYLLRQLELVEPQLVVALGRVAAQYLLSSNAPLGRLRGQLHSYGPAATPLLVTYHPAYLLRSPAEKRRSWEDLKLIRNVLTTGRSDA